MKPSRRAVPPQLMDRRGFLGVATTGVLGAVVGAGTVGRVVPRGEAADAGLGDPAAPMFLPPADPARWPAFREWLEDWRQETRRKLAYNDGQYRRPEFAWAARCFACAFIMVGDERFLDARRGRWRAESFLAAGRRDFGGYDAVVLWHAYPRLGLDDRNQFDFYRELPGGLTGLRQLVRRLQDRGVRVFVDYNPWDTGTRREGRADVEVLGELVGAIGADGIFLDTLDQGAGELRARLDAVRPGVVLESEIALPVARIHDHHLSWAQWFPDGPVPGVLRNKWFERRHLQHQIRRWDGDHTAELHAAWMNGSGILVWENVFGSWVGWSPRDRSLLRAMRPVQRRFADLFSGEGWTPLVPTLAAGVYANAWEAPGVRLWTLVNRSEQVVEGPLLEIRVQRGDAVFDLIAGRVVAGAGVGEITPAEGVGWRRVAGRLAPRGVGGFVVARPAALGPDFPAFLRAQRRTAAAADERTEVEVPETKWVSVRPARWRGPRPANMVEIEGGQRVLRFELRVRECGFYGSVPSPGHRLASSYEFQIQTFERAVHLTPYALEVTPVTNAQYAEFLRRSGYRPRHPENFLRHWLGGKPPAGKEEHPVVYVDLDDARAYARWAGKRLPTEEEWQYGAAGPEARRFPWGETMAPGRCNGGESGGTTPVHAFPAGRSWCGLLDLCGNAWEWTESERSDGRTRFAMLKGGSWYAARGSGWYMDGGPRPNPFSAKMLLTWSGLDRCATVGFRCAVDGA